MLEEIMNYLLCSISSLAGTLLILAVMLMEEIKRLKRDHFREVHMLHNAIAMRDEENLKLRSRIRALEDDILKR